jgi:threonine dehydrogenase-like Zn-dependent dehydrogenase
MQAIASVLTRFNAPLELIEFTVPPLAPGQVLVEIEAAGVCGSDVHMWHGQDPRTPLPIILGHEGVGRIVDTGGSRVDIYSQTARAGDRVSWERGVTCGRCYFCAVLHEPYLCTERWAYGIHRSSTVPPYLNGCYASHIILDGATPLIPLDASDDAALIVAASCSGATAAHTFDYVQVHPGDTVVVLGPGPLGVFSIALARAAGAEHIVVIGGATNRLALCKAAGATSVLDRHATSQAERQQAIRDLTQGRGADLVIEAAGTVAAAQEGMDLARRGGTVAIVGIATPVGEMTLAPFEQVVRKGVRVQGVWVSDLRHTLRAISIVRRDPAALAGLVTHRFSLDHATQALEAVESRDALKVVLMPGDMSAA